MTGMTGVTNRYPIAYTFGAVSNPDAVQDVDGGQRRSVDGVQKVECQTCKTRKYVDGSNDPNVSFKTPGHIAPGESYSRVMAHEQEHMAQARSDSAKPEAQLVSASISLRMGVCPECGRTYVAGGTTNTTIQYQESNPYERSKKLVEGSFLAGQTIDERI